MSLSSLFFVLVFFNFVVALSLNSVDRYMLDQGMNAYREKYHRVR